MVHSYNYASYFKTLRLVRAPQALVSIGRPHWSLTVIDKLSIRSNMTALLLMDFQRMVVDSYAVDKEALLDRVKRLALAARNSGAMVIHVVVGFQLGYPEVSRRNSVFSSLKAAGRLAACNPTAEIDPELTPQP